MVRNHHRRRMFLDRTFARHETRLKYLDSLIGESDIACVNDLRMNRRTFGVLCELLHADGRVKRNETISRYFNSILHGVLRLQENLLVSQDPIPANCIVSRWRWFENCLGALDGTYIEVRVSEVDKPRYRTRKGKIATNVLGVCSRDMKFIFVLPGWEGSASDSRVLRDAINRQNGLKIPKGYYYLVDGGYTNGEGFLAPYKGVAYHLSEWGRNVPRNHEKYFNMKHASARNVIERCFGLLKIRWSILRSTSFFPITTQCRIITTCCILHNLIRREMSLDPAKIELDRQVDAAEDTHQTINEDHEIIDTVEASTQWTEWRNTLAMQMYNEWRLPRGH
ncbi:hypothetical protein CsatB_008230 [Cannabis sativa]|uniref:uncharacterized protein LOC115695044 n=1 Tax=Cannabis sativa TaxID=3483 RepID=UPI0029CA4EA8|nr:uncharacterized protein LOC115695044 [Cannabis sativa]